MRKFFAILLMFFGFAAGANAAAHLYSVDGITVEAKGTSARQARELALSSARTVALRAVFSRVLTSADAKNIEFPVDYNVEKFVQSMRILDERTTADTYSATVVVTISRDVLLSYITSQSMEAHEALPASVTLVVRQTDLIEALEEAILRDIGNAIPMSVSASSGNLGVEVVIADGNIEFQSGVTARYSTPASVITVIGDYFKTNVAAWSASGESTPIVFAIGGLGDWLAKQAKLSQIPELSNMTVSAISPERVQVEVRGRAPAVLMRALSAAGFNAELRSNHVFVRR